MKVNRPTRTIAVLLITVGLLIAGAVASAAAQGEERAVRSVLEEAYEKTVAADSYAFRSQLIQTTYPTPKLANVGRSVQTQQLHLDGTVDHLAGDVSMSLWSGREGDLPIEIRTENGVVFGRMAGEEAWQRSDLATDLFAPGGDAAGFLATAINIESMDVDADGLSSGRLPLTLLPAGALDGLTRYRFDVDSIAYATQIRDQMEAQLRREGRLPMGLNLDLVREYVDMHGTGEVWINERGQPVYQVIHLSFPPDDGELSRVEAEIMTTFDEMRQSALPSPALLFTHPTHFSDRLTAQLQNTLRSPSVHESLVNLSVALVLMGGALSVVQVRQKKLVYGTLAFSMVFNPLAMPLLQTRASRAFNEYVAQQQVQEEEAAAQADAEQEIRDLFQDSDFNPQVDPLTLSPPEDSPFTVNEDGAAVISDEEAYRSTDPLMLTGFETGIDSDGDGLTDEVELLQLGTDADGVDTDGDGISDYGEVVGFQINGVTWYLNPLQADSNGDGLLDGVECNLRADVSPDRTLPPGFSYAACEDTDGDLTPDVWDYDNDADGVPDRVDSAPVYVGPLSTSAQNKVDINLTGYQTGEELLVDFQIRPTDQQHLFLTNNVYKWAANDTQANVRRVLTDTLATYQSALGNTPAANADNGDFIVTPLLEITMPWNPATPSAGLPVSPTYAGVITTGTPISTFVDLPVVETLGIELSKDTSTGDVVAYVPLAIVRDTVGDTPVAWGARMLYRPIDNVWPVDHEARLLWLVMGLNDECDTTGIGDAAYADYCSAANPQNWRSQGVTIYHRYYEEFTLTGLTVREDLDTTFAAVAQNQATVSTNGYEPYLFHLADSLDDTLRRALLTDGVRFDVAEIGTRFDDQGPLPDGDARRWGIPKNALSVESGFYGDQTAAFTALKQTLLPDVLADAYTAPLSGTVATVLFAREETYRTALIGDANMSVVGDTVNVGLSSLISETQVGLNWAPHVYQSVTGWENLDVFDFFTVFEVAVAANVSLADLIDLVGETPEDVDLARSGVIRLAKAQYATFFTGASAVVAFDGTVVQTESVVESDYLLGPAEKPIIRISDAILNQLQNAMINLSTTTLDGKSVANSEVSQLTKALQLLNVMGASEDDFSYPTAKGVLGVSKGAVGAIITVIKKIDGLTGISPGGLSGNGFFYGSQLVTLIYVGLMAASFLYGDLDKQGWQIVMKSAAVIAGALGTAYTYMSYAAFQGYSIAAAMGNAAATTRITTVLQFQRITPVFTAMLIVLVAVGALLYNVVSGAVELGSIGFNQLLAQTFATIVIAIVLAIISASFIGAIFVAAFGLLDAILRLICSIANSAADSFLCLGATQALTEAFAKVIYQTDPVIDFDREDRVRVVTNDFTLANPDLGFASNNPVWITQTVTTTLHMDDHILQGNRLLLKSDVEDAVRDSAFAYSLQLGGPELHETLNFGDVTWNDPPGDALAQQVFTAGNAFNYRSGVNSAPSGMSLTEGFQTKRADCWWTWVTSLYICNLKAYGDSIHFDLGSNFALDMFPATFDDFANIQTYPDGGVRLGNLLGTPAQADADGDGLRGPIVNGPDPDDSTWDADGDGLSDFWEIQNGFDATDANPDGDALEDYWEAFYNTNPWLADSDYDGLADGEEVFLPESINAYDNTVGVIWSGGWDIVYDYAGATAMTTRVTSDPLSINGDGDELLDNFERIYGTNPNAAETFNAFNMLDRDYGVPARSFDYARPGDLITYTVDVQNALDTNRRILGLVEAELPPDVLQQTQTIDLLGQASTNISGQAIVPATISESGEISLTLRAGGVVEDVGTGRRLWLHLNELEGTTFYDDSGSATPHDATCLNDCPNTRNGFLSFEGNDALQVADHPDFDLNQFSISMWILPLGLNQYKTLLTKGGDFQSPFQLRIANNAFLEGLVLADNCTTLRSATATTPLSINVWQQVTMTFDGFNIRLYKNGDLIGTGTADGVCTDTNERIEIGRRPNGGYFNGFIDEIEITARALEASEIAAKFGDKAVYLTFDEGTPGQVATVLDQSGNLHPIHEGIQGGVYGSLQVIAASTTREKGAIGSGIRLGFVDTPTIEHIIVHGALGLESSDDAFTFSAWLKDSGVDMSAEYGFTYGERLFSINPRYFSRSRPEFAATFRPSGALVLESDWCSDLTLLSSAQPFFDNTTDWFHFALSADPATNTYSLYKNGSLLVSKTWNCNDIDLSPDGWGFDFQLGHWWINHVFSYCTPDSPDNCQFTLPVSWEGSVDEMIVERRALNAAEVALQYEQSFRRLEMFFDEPPGQFRVVGNTQYQYEATCTGSGNCPDTGFPSVGNQGLRFSGNDYMTLVPSTQELGLYDDSFTVAAWINGSDYSGNNTILGTDSTTTRRGLELGVRNGNPFMGFRSSDTTSGTALTEDEWVHLAFVYCATCSGGTQTIFVNGVAAGSNTGRASFIGTDLVRIGRAAGGRYFDGLIDHLVIEERALSAAQVQALMLEMPVLNLHADEEYGTIIASNTFADTTRFANDATCSGSTCPRGGFNGQMRETPEFDGDDDLLSIPAATELDLDEFTLSLWVRPTRSDVQQTLLTKASGSTSINYRLRLNSSGLARFSMEDATCSGNNMIATSPSALPLAQWSHLAATFDGVNTLRLYLNGQLVDQQTYGSQTGACTSSQPITIGQDFAGNLDEIAIFGQRLSDAEIADLFAYQAAWVDTKIQQLIGVDVDNPTLNPPVDQVISGEPNQMFVIQASDPSGIFDVSATVNHGSAAVNRDGDVWILTYDPPANPQPNQIPATVNIIATDGVGRTSAGQTALTVDAVAPRFFIGSRTVLSDTLVFNGSVQDIGGDEFSQGASGILDDSVTFELLDEFGISVAGPVSVTLGPPGFSGQRSYTVNYPLPVNALGRYTFVVKAEDLVGNKGSATFAPFDQLVQNHPPYGGRIFAGTVITREGTALSGVASGVPYPYTSQSTLFHFEDTPGTIVITNNNGDTRQVACTLCLDTLDAGALGGELVLSSTATTYLDSSGNEYNATCTDCPTNGSTGRLGRALSFNGSTNWLDLAYSPAISTVTQLGLDESFTLMAWVRPAAVTGVQPILGNAAGSLMLGLNGANISFSDGVTTTTGAIPVASGTWTHLAWRYDAAAGEQTVFVNGVADDASAALPFAGSGALTIGRSGSDFFGGRLDEFALYDRALTRNEIYDISNYFSDPVNINAVELRLRRASDAPVTDEEGNWFNLNLTTSNRQTYWSYPFFGAIEGPYQADIRVSDSVGNERFIRDVWIGDLDTQAPQLEMVFNDLGGGNAEISCTATDWSLVTDRWQCPVGPRNDVYEDAPWFTDIYSGVLQLKAFTTTLQTASSSDSFMQACDAYGRCATLNGKRGPGGVTEGLALWLRSDEGTSATLDGAPIEVWEDQSPSGNDAMQMTLALQPTYEADPDSTLRGNPTVFFDTSGDSMSLDPTLLTTGTSGRTTFAVVNPTGGQQRPVLSHGADVAGQRSDMTWSVEYQTVDVGDHEFGRFETFQNWIYGWRIVSYELPDSALSDQWQIRMDGVPLSVTTLSGTPQSVNTGISGAAIGDAFDGSASPFWGNMAEILHYTRPLSDTERNQVESYLAFKYGLSLADGVDYLNSSGSVVWDATANSQYNNAVSGLMRDDVGALDIRYGRPTEPTAIMTITHGTDPDNPAPFPNDSTYFVYGHNGLPSGANIDLASGLQTIVYTSRFWKVEETGVITDTTVQINFAEISGFIYNAFGNQNSALFIDNDGDGDFSNAIVYNDDRSIDGDVVTWTGVDFQDGAVFALIFTIFDEGISLSKSADRTTAADGEFVRFQIELDNGFEGPAGTYTLTDIIPPELNYVTGSLTYTVNLCCGDPGPDPNANVNLVDAPPLLANEIVIPAVARIIFTYTAQVDSSELITVSNLANLNQAGSLYPLIGRADVGLRGDPTCAVEIDGDGITDYVSIGANAVQEAINAAPPGSTLKIAGNCVGVQFTSGVSQTAYIDKDLTLIGGYALSPTNWLTPSDPVMHETILDANAQGRVAFITGGADVTLQNLIVQNGSADGAGNIYQAGGSLTLDHVVVRDGDASVTGGGIYATGALTLTHSAVVNNSALPNEGGGIALDGGTLVAVNTTIAGNQAGSGGGLFLYGSSGATAELHSVTIAHNLVLNSGGGISAGGPVEMLHTVLADNSAPIGPDCYGTATVLASGYSVVGDNSGCLLAFSSEDLIGVDPILGGLGDYGGASPTVPLLPGSPAIDIGGSCAATDQRDAARPQLAACDAGAFESQGFALVQGSGSGQSTFIDSPFSAPLVVTVTATNPVEPIGGGVVTYDSPDGGPGINPDPTFAALDALGQAVANVTANGTPGSYDVAATAAGAAGTGTFALSNNECNYIVTNANDIGFGSLRDGVERTCTGGVITFAADFSIVLQDPITITNPALTIDATGRSIEVLGDDGDGVDAVRNFTVSSTAGVTMTGLTVAYGAATEGAGIYIDGGTVTLNDVYVQFNSAGNGGGSGISVINGGVLTVNGGAIRDNSGNGLGGGVKNVGGTVTLTGVTVSSNVANGGGGISNQNGVVNVESSAIYSNTAQFFGGGLLSFNTATFTVTNTTLSGNSANGAAGSHGGGAMNQYNGGMATFVNTSIAGNRAPNQAGKAGLWIENGSISLTQSALADNNGSSCELGPAVASGGHNVVGDASCALIGTGDLNNVDPLLGPLADNGGDTWSHLPLSGSPALNKTAACAQAVDQRGITRPQGTGCDSGSVELLNTAPVALADSYDVSQNVVKRVFAENGILANDSDANGDTVSAVLVTPPASGTLALAVDGSFVYTPTTDFLGSVTFTYQADDGQLQSALTEVTLDILPPVCFVEYTGDNVTDIASHDSFAVHYALQDTTADFIKVAGTCAGVNVTATATQLGLIDRSLTVAGGYDAADWLAAPDARTHPTVLDAQDGGRVLAVGFGTVVTLTKLTLQNGVASTGAGIESYGSQLTLEEVTVRDNSASERGGGINVPFGVSANLTITRSAIHGNSAPDGGGMWLEVDSVTIVNSTISGNFGENEGGAFVLAQGSMDMRSSTIAANTSLGTGDGVAVIAGALDIARSIVADHGGGDNCTVYIGLGGTLIDGGDNLADDASCAPGFTVADPLLVVLDDNGGSTLSHALQIGSPAADVLPSCVETIDQVGNTRPLDAACDLGAYERPNAEPTALDDLYLGALNRELVVPATTGVLFNDSDLEGDALTASLLAPPLQGSLVFTPDGSFAYSPTIGFTGLVTFTYVASDTYNVNPANSVATVELDIRPERCFVDIDGDNTTDFAGPDAKTLQDAVDAASSGATLRIAGLCAGGTTVISNTQTVYIDKPLTLEGGYSALDWTIGTNPSLNPTILDGQFENRVVYVTLAAGSVTLHNLTLRNGFGENGGGVAVVGSSLTLTGTTLINNEATFNGGAVWVEDGNVTIGYSTLQENATGGTGGAIGVTQRDSLPTTVNVITVTHSAIVSNTATNAGGALGLFDAAGLHDTSVYVEQSTLSGNSVTTSDGTSFETGGGAIALLDPQTTITLLHTTVVSNSAPFLTNRGGLWLPFGTLELVNSVVAYHDANCGGGNVTSLDFNIDDDGTCSLGGANDQSSVDPLLGPLGVNGGRTATHVPLELSPAVDVIPVLSGSCNSSGAVSDQRGFVRPNGVNCDVGAVERLQCWDVSIAAGWNLISVPLLPDDPSVSLLFPNATSQAFAYASGYVTVTEMTPGQGVWLNFDAAETVEICGRRVSDPVPVTEGWNIVGAYVEPIDVELIGTSVGDIESSFFGYDSGYVAATTLQPGRGYWVKVSADGELAWTLGPLAPPNLGPQQACMPTWSAEFTISDGVAAQTVTFGQAPGTSDAYDPICDILAPPPPPTGVLDGRLSTTTEDVFVDYQAEIGLWTVVFAAGNDGGPLTFTWDPSRLPSTGWVLRDPFGGTLVNVDMNAENSYVLPESLSGLTNLVIEGPAPTAVSALDIAAESGSPRAAASSAILMSLLAVGWALIVLRRRRSS